MIDLLFVPSAMLYAFAPVLVLIAVGVQIYVHERARMFWVVFAVGLVWGAYILINPYNIAWVPNMFIANFQRPYTVIRAGLVLLYVIIAIASIIRKTNSLKWASAGLIMVLVGDLLWSHVAGRYVGP